MRKIFIAKRIIAAVLSAVLLLSLAACKESEKKPDTETNKPSVTTKAQDTKPAAQSDTTEQQNTPSEPEKVSPVYTDWSKLTPYEPMKEVYTYHPGYCAGGTLQARDDYGALIPYIGSHYDEDPNFDFPNYGLVTDKGELVTDPVYADIDFMGDFIRLRRGYRSSDTVNEWGYYDCAEVITVASSDGHWVRELPSNEYFCNCGFGLLMTLSSDQSLDLWNTDGEKVMHFDGTLFKERCDKKFTWAWTSVDWVDDKIGYVSYEIYANDEEIGDEYAEWVTLYNVYLDFQSGEVMDKPPKGYPEEIDYSLGKKDTPDPPEPPKVDGYDDLSPITDDVSGETYFYTVVDRCDDDVDVTIYEIIFDRNGHLLGKPIERFYFDRATFLVRAGLYRSFEENCFCLYSLSDNKLVFCYRIRSNLDDWL